MENLVLLEKTIEETNVKIIFNDSNVLFKEYLGLYVNNELNLLPSIDLYAALKIIDNSGTLQELKEELIANSWLNHLKGVN